MSAGSLDDDFGGCSGIGGAKDLPVDDNDDLDLAVSGALWTVPSLVDSS